MYANFYLISSNRLGTIKELVNTLCCSHLSTGTHALTPLRLCKIHLMVSPQARVYGEYACGADASSGRSLMEDRLHFSNNFVPLEFPGGRYRTTSIFLPERPVLFLPELPLFLSKHVPCTSNFRTLVQTVFNKQELAFRKTFPERLAGYF